MVEVLHLIGNALVLLMLIPLLAFILLYSMGSPWRSDPLGIALMSQKAMLLFLVLVGLLSISLPAGLDAGLYTLRVGGYAVILVLLVLDVINLRRVQTGSSRPLFFSWLRKSYRRRK